MIGMAALAGKFDGHVFVDEFHQLELGDHRLKREQIADAFGRGKEGGVADGFTGGGIGHGFAKESSAGVAFHRDLDLDRGSGDANEVLRMGVEDVNLQKAVGMKNELEVVSGAVFSDFHELPAMRSDVNVMPAGTAFAGISTATEEEEADSKKE
tara:strand:+ start:369 stop:830 length:462 start_codon:yes stop_codon:yes gene_type:complete